jgi:hypothetical protein
MILKIAYFEILGLPVIMYLGVITLVLFLSAAAIPLLRKKGINIPFAWHMRLAYLAIALALLHGLFGMAAYL